MRHVWLLYQRWRGKAIGGGNEEHETNRTMLCSHRQCDSLVTGLPLKYGRRYGMLKVAPHSPARESERPAERGCGKTVMPDEETRIRRPLLTGFLLVVPVRLLGMVFQVDKGARHRGQIDRSSHGCVRMTAAQVD